MIAAIYARKSTDQNGVSDKEKSVTRQVEHARTYARTKGWTVADEHVYVDDGVSGAEFANRPGFVRLMNALSPPVPFQVLILSDEDRLGRESFETGYTLKRLSQAGVKVYNYVKDREVPLDTAADKFMMSAMNFVAESEREKARERTYDAMVRKARAGHVTGGSCFGYRNVDVAGPDGRRSHVIREIAPVEAAVVRRIFELCAEGHGQKAIAKRLNDEGALPPRAQQGRPLAWAPSSVRAVLFRPLYRGEIVWNQTRKRDRWGQSHRSERTEGDWIRVDAPQLRMVPEALWQAAHQRMSAARAIYLKGTNGRPFGRPAIGTPSKYLLTNLAQCGQCGGSLTVQTRSHRHFRAKFYGCAAYHDRGKTVCGNGTVIPMEDADGIVLEAVFDEILTPDVLEEAVAKAQAMLLDEGKQAPANRDRLDQKIRRVERERERLVDAVAMGGDLESLVTGLRAKESHLAALKSEFDALKGTELHDRQFDRRLVHDELGELAKSWREVLAGAPIHARPILAKLLDGRVTFTPLKELKTWELRGRGTISGLFEAVLPPGMASPSTPSWNQIMRWLQEMAELRESGTVAA